MSEIIKVRNLYTKYSDTFIHENIGFSICKGEIFGILGGSGSGKSTLLKNMIYLQKPHSGSIEIFGRDIWSLKEHRRGEILDKIGVMFQFGALFSSMSVIDNVCMPLVQKGYFSDSEIKKNARFWIEMVGLNSDTAHKFPHELSGGMKKRAALARALITSPEILFLDEPTSGLDPRSSEKFDELILRLKDILHISIVMVTHDLDSIKDSVDRFILLENKRIAFDGTLQDLRTSGIKAQIFSGARGERFLES